MTAAELYPGFDLDCPAIKDPIEPGVLPVCDALNALPSVHTLWSCEGHAEQPSTPYVVFIAPQALAFSVNELLSPKTGGTGLKYNWRLIASFRFDGSLQYILEPNDVQLLGRGLRLFRLFGRKAMDKELHRLADLISTLKMN